MRLNKLVKKGLSLLLTATLAVGTGIYWPASDKQMEAEAAYGTNTVSVHDPSIVKGDDGYYYIFGSHMAWAKSKNLIDWTTFTNNINSENKNYSKYSATASGHTSIPNTAYAWAASGDSGYAPNGNLWAPDVIYNTALGKWCMYMSVNGIDWHSSIIMMTADSLSGNWTYAGTVVYSGFTNNSVTNFNRTDYQKVTGDTKVASRYLSGSSWNTNYGAHAIDPSVKYDEDGNLWMTFGSWSGGIYMLKLDSSTGLRDYTYTYSLDTDTSDGTASDPYMGIRLAGRGSFTSGEASYIVKMGNYWYMFISYEGLTATGGYSMRVFRSEKITGPYVDQDGNTPYISGYGVGHGDVGYKLMGNYQFDGMSMGEVAQGHNSAFVDSDGRMYVVYHTRYNNGTEWHNVRTHELYMNKAGWPVADPGDYRGTAVDNSTYQASDLVGTYGVITHRHDNDYASLEVETEETVYLNSDGTISGALAGTWTVSGKNLTLNLYQGGESNKVAYQGVVTKSQIVNGRTETAFTVAASNVAIWGRKLSSSISYDAKLVQAYSFDGLAVGASTVGSVLTSTASNTAPQYAAGKHGKALSFTGADSDGIKLTTLNSNDFTISFWANAKTSTQYTPMLFIANSVEDGSAEWLSLGTQVNASSVNKGPGIWSCNGIFNVWFAGITNSNAVKLNTWQNYTLTVSGGFATLYLDGNRVGGGFVDDNIGSGSTVYLGVNNWDTPFNGFIDDLSIYDGVVSPASIAELASGNTATKDMVLIPSPMKSYDFNGNIAGGKTVGSKIVNAASSSTPTYVAGRNSASDENDKAVSFTGNGSDGIYLGNLGVSGSYAISFWYKANATSQYTPTVFVSNETSEASNWISMALQGWQESYTNGPMVWSHANAYYDLLPTVTGKGKLNTWQNLILSVSAGRGVLYLDGEEIGNGPVSSTITEDAGIYLGVNFWDTPFNGAIDDLEIYDEALTPAAITYKDSVAVENLQFSEDRTSATATLVDVSTWTSTEVTADRIESTVLRKATCTEAEVTRYTAYFTTEDNIIVSKSADITTKAALGHDWGDYKIIFTTNGKSATAIRTCQRDSSHVERVKANVTAAVTTPATTTTKGITTYTAVATFSDGVTISGTKAVSDLPLIVEPEGSISVKMKGYLGKKVTLKKGKTLQIKATASNGNKITYKTSKKKVATVTSNGKVKAKGLGKAVITLTANNTKSVKITVTVVKKAKTAKTFTLKSKKVTVSVGKTKKLALKKMTAKATTKFSYKSKNKKIAKVDSYGIIKGVKKGSTKITVKNGKKKVTVKVTVK